MAYVLFPNAPTSGISAPISRRRKTRKWLTTRGSQPARRSHGAVSRGPQGGAAREAGDARRKAPANLLNTYSGAPVSQNPQHHHRPLTHGSSAISSSRCIVLLALDGFDVLAISFAAPGSPGNGASIAASWVSCCRWNSPAWRWARWRSAAWRTGWGAAHHTGLLAHHDRRNVAGGLRRQHRLTVHYPFCHRPGYRRHAGGRECHRRGIFQHAPAQRLCR